MVLHFSDFHFQMFVHIFLIICLYFKILLNSVHLILQDGYRTLHSHLFAWSDLKFLHNSLWISFPSQVHIFLLLSFNFTLFSAGTAKSNIRCLSFVFVDYYKVLLSSREKLICWYLKISEEFVRLILTDSFWVVRMVKFKFLSQFPVDHVVHPVASRLIFFRCSLLHSLIMW